MLIFLINSSSNGGNLVFVGMSGQLGAMISMRNKKTYGYYVAYKSITLLCILFMFIEMKFIHCHSCVMFAMKSMSMCNE